ncbi:MAG TPA: hypothetical protein VMI54_10055 [Polyangiaceae bacterium]|nr:hypothetical protein [Polyangiaceae bacterium]
MAILSLVACSTPSPVEAGSGGTAGGPASGGSGGSAGKSAGGQGNSVGGTSSGSGGSSGGSSAAAGAMNVDCSGFTSASAPAPTFCNFKFVITNVSPPCSGALPCHGPGGGGVNPLEIPTMDDATLMHNMETVISPDCGNIPIIKPGDPANSALTKVLTTGCSANVPTMPYMCDPTSNCVPKNYEQQIEAWIAAGAKLQ